MLYFEIKRFLYYKGYRYLIVEVFYRGGRGEERENLLVV